MESGRGSSRQGTAGAALHLLDRFEQRGFVGRRARNQHRRGGHFVGEKGGEVKAQQIVGACSPPRKHIVGSIESTLTLKQPPSATASVAR